MRIKVHGGVIGGEGKGLCASCKYGAVRENAAGGLEVWCGAYSFIGSGPSQKIRKPVVRCSEYKDSGAIDRHDLEQIAWHITTDKKTGKIGFITPADRVGKDND